MKCAGRVSSDRMNGNFGRAKFWITINARAYTGERKRERAKLVGQPERIDIARRQKFGFARSAPLAKRVKR